MKLLIVDDEPIIRTGLASVISWKELGITLLTPAASAEEALERLAVEKPQILLTDIRMKGKTGLQLAEEACAMLPGLEVIILSGYGDFAYAQQALRQGVGDYLLKTSKPEEIMKAVMQAKCRLLERWEEESRAERLWKEGERRQFLQWIIEGDVADGSEVPPFLLAGKGSGRAGDEVWQVVVAGADGWGDSGSTPSLLLFAVQNMLEDLLPGASFLVQRERLICVFRLERDRERRLGRLGSAADWVERQLKCRLRMSAGEPATSPERLHHGYSTAMTAFRYHALVPARILDYSGIAGRRGGRTVLTQDEETLLGSLLLDRDAVGLRAWTGRLIDELICDPECTVESYMACIHSAVLAAHRWLARTLRVIGREDGYRIEPWNADENEAAGLREELFRHLHDTMTMYHSRLGEGRQSHVERAKAFIESCPAQELSLQQVAGHVHLHPGHLSELFKKETGSTFGDFVTGFRMRKAMQLLTVTPAKVSEVALMVGYEDVKYFSRLFKKHTGKTPSEYREGAFSGNGCDMTGAGMEPGAS